MARQNERGLELTFHKATKRWCKTIDGQRRYFGSGGGVSDRPSYKKALDAYRKFMDDRTANQSLERRMIVEAVRGPGLKTVQDLARFIAISRMSRPEIQISSTPNPHLKPEQVITLPAEFESMVRNEADAWKGVMPKPPAPEVAAPAAQADSEVTVKVIVDEFIASRKRKLEVGELSRRTLADYEWTCEFLTDRLGKKSVTSLTAPDFAKLRGDIAKLRGPVRLGIEVQQVRCVFKYAFEAGLIEVPARFGPDFQKPPKRLMRLIRQSKPPKILQPHEIQKLIANGSAQMKAMIYLGINAGLGNADVAHLQIKHVDLDKGILDYPRGKTGIQRRVMLWPETVTAIRAALEERPAPRQAEDESCVFITRCRRRWHHYSEGNDLDAVGTVFHRMLRDIGIERAGVGFYALRHTFETIAGETRDQPAVDRIMGHERDDMATVYREWTRDERENARLAAVTHHVRLWLLTPGKSHAA